MRILKTNVFSMASGQIMTWQCALITVEGFINYLDPSSFVAFTIGSFVFRCVASRFALSKGAARTFRLQGHKGLRQIGNRMSADRP